MSPTTSSDPTDHHARLARELDLAGVKPCFAAADAVVARPGVVLAALMGAHGRDEVLRAMGGTEQKRRPGVEIWFFGHTTGGTR